AGVSRLRLVDFDSVCPSNINRQLYALESTIGRLKIDVAKERVLDINPSCQVETVHGFIDAETVWEFIGEYPDIVIDAIDGLNPKVDLLEAVRMKEVPVISCLGAAMRSDATSVRVAPLSKVHHCPLGRVVRQRLRRRGVPVDFDCVYSEELLPNPLPVRMPVDAPGEEQVLSRGRVRNILGSLPTITGIFGLTAANAAIQHIIKKQ
ncbi:MAG TPA: ThiF family adenylyltransferase, partial [Armatimonadota bacterium]|nr:ThiF family adenylyltransferase [Armatimonadota bacterium]